MASSSPSPIAGPQSFTKMATGDVESIGAHCQMAFCHQLDFLPFRCESCKGTYCLDHRTETAHSCSNAGAWARARRQDVHAGPTMRKPTLLNHEQQCSDPSCKTLINTNRTPGVHCTTCNRHYCLKHRMQEDHDCKNLKPLGARPVPLQAQRERTMAALSKLRNWGLNKKAAEENKAASKTSGFTFGQKTRTSTISAQKALNDLKRNAKGESSIPQDKRIYLHVEASADTTKAKYPTGDFFYNKEWSVGRVLDVAAKALQVENVNNRGGGEADKLRIFHVEGGRLLEFSEKVGAPVQNGNTVVLLRGVGPPVPDLIEA